MCLRIDNSAHDLRARRQASVEVRVLGSKGRSERVPYSGFVRAQGGIQRYRNYRVLHEDTRWYGNDRVGSISSIGATSGDHYQSLRLVPLDVRAQRFAQEAKRNHSAAAY